MKRLIVAILVVLALTIATAAPAFAHVHGVTPLTGGDGGFGATAGNCP